MKHSYRKSAAALGAIATVCLLELNGAQAAGNPFQANDIPATTHHGKAARHPISVAKGKCGSGKCGSAVMRRMMDADKDGSISHREYIRWATGQAESRFDRMDINNDRVISSSEMMAFKRMNGGT